MHILYSFNNIFPPCVSAVCVSVCVCACVCFTVSIQPPSKFPSVQRRDVTDVCRHVSAKERMYFLVVKHTPSYGWLLASEPADSFSKGERESRNELDSGLSPPITATSQVTCKQWQRTGNCEVGGFKIFFFLVYTPYAVISPMARLVATRTIMGY